MSRLLRAVTVAIVLAASAAAAQEQWERFRGGGGRSAIRRAIRPPPASTAASISAASIYTSDRREAGGSGLVDRLLGRRHQLLDPPRRAHQDDDQPAAGRRTESPDRPHLRSRVVPVPDPERHRRRHRALHRRGRRDAARLSREGRLPLGRRFLGAVRVGQLGQQHQQGAAAGRVSDSRHSARPSDPADAVRVQGPAADSVDQFLEPVRRPDLRALRAERRAALPRHRRRSRAASW